MSVTEKMIKIQGEIFSVDGLEGIRRYKPWTSPHTNATTEPTVRHTSAVLWETNRRIDICFTYSLPHTHTFTTPPRVHVSHHSCFLHSCQLDLVTSSTVWWHDVSENRRTRSNHSFFCTCVHNKALAQTPVCSSLVRKGKKHTDKFRKCLKLQHLIRIRISSFVIRNDDKLMKSKTLNINIYSESFGIDFCPTVFLAVIGEKR